MKLMSFSMSTEAVRNRTKTVTRRLGWKYLKPGEELWAVEKALGLKKGEHVKRICRIRVVEVRREPLDRLRYAYDFRECAREGFPLLHAPEFIEMFCKANQCGPDILVQRISFEYVDGEA